MEKEQFNWEYPPDMEQQWQNGFKYDEAAYWGGFPSKAEFDPASYLKPEWAIGPFTKYPGNPVLAPGPDAWDAGRFGGGVRNGSVIYRNGLFYYFYRAERAIPPINGVAYMCKIGLAISSDGVHFEKKSEINPLFGADDLFSYEDVALVEHDGTYFLFCNRWDWAQHDDTEISGIWLATSSDLLHWEERGLVFSGTERTRRNGVVLQDPENHAVRANGRFVMYINDGLIGYSDDMLTWESRSNPNTWPGGEGCFALANYDSHPERIVLFTGGYHSGHFYAIGEVCFDKSNPEKPLEWLPRPILAADPAYPFEVGYSASDPTKRISYFRDCIFFNALTRHAGLWWMYYGGSEYYTCLANAPDHS